MKKQWILLVMASFLYLGVKAQLYSTLNGNVSFFSTTPVENIDAHSAKALAVLSTEKRELAFSIPNTSFQFKNKLMQEHFNEKYMESEKFPNSTFKGKINETIDLKVPGEYKVTVTGKLNIHGVELDRTISGSIVVKDGTITLKSEFPIKVADHKIQIPTIVTAKIAEEITAKIETVLLPKK